MNLDRLKEGFNHSVTLNLQKKGSRLSKCVTEEVQEKRIRFYNNRKINLITSDWADLVDREYPLEFLSDPTSEYALRAAYALGSRIDKEIIGAILGEASVGFLQDKKILLPYDQGIAPNYTDDLSSVISNLTVSKLRMAREILDEAVIDDDDEQFCVLTPKQLNDLLETTEVKSEYYNAVKDLVDGKVNTFMGFNFKIVSPSVMIEGSNTVYCFCKSAVILASDGDIKTDITIRNQNNKKVAEVSASLSFGASRMDEKKVVHIFNK